MEGTSSLELPRLPAKPPVLHPPPQGLVQAGPGRYPRYSCSSPRGGFSHPDFALGSELPLFHTGPTAGNVFAFPFLVRLYPYRSLPKPHSSSPTPCKLQGTLPALPHGQLVRHLALPRPEDLDPVPQHECQGRGDLASHLFFLGTKYAFKSQSCFTGKRWKLLETASCPSYDSQQGHFPSPALCLFCRHTN